MSKKSTSSLVKSTLAISKVNPVLLVNTMTDTLNSVSKTVDKYFDYKIEKEKTSRLRIALKTELKNAKIQLEAFKKILRFNIKFLNKQSKDVIKYRESILIQLKQYNNIYSTLAKAYSELALRDNVNKEILDSIGDKLSEINNSHLEIIKQLRPTSFTTINM
ncbi:MAG: hypothetical protein ACUVQP_08570 [Bacteroidales bacterium]